MQQATGGEKSRVVAKPARSDIQRGGIALDAFASALFWGYVAIMFGSSEIKIAESIGLAPENVALICGNVVALVAVGLLGPRAHGSHLFVLGLAGSGTACILQTVSLLSPEMVPVAWSRLFACGASAILVLAWCEHISSETSQERPLFLALCSLLTIVIVLVSIQLGARSAILFGGVLPVVSAALGAYRTRASARTAPSVTIQPPFPLYLIVILFVFGFMISFFSLLNRRTGTVENFMIPAGIDPFLAGWTVLVLVIAGCVWMLLPQRHASLVTTVLIPLASLGLLLPPFLRYGLQETLPAVVAFIVICEAIICSVGPSNAKKYFHIGSFTFVFWTRSFGLIGMIVGYAAAILLFDIMKIAIDFDILLIMFAAYAILCLTVARAREYPCRRGARACRALRSDGTGSRSARAGGAGPQHDVRAEGPVHLAGNIVNAYQPHPSEAGRSQPRRADRPRAGGVGALKKTRTNPGPDEVHLET